MSETTVSSLSWFSAYISTFSRKSRLFSAINTKNGYEMKTSIIWNGDVFSSTRLAAMKLVWQLVILERKKERYDTSWLRLNMGIWYRTTWNDWTSWIQQKYSKEGKYVKFWKNFTPWQGDEEYWLWGYVAYTTAAASKFTLFFN